MPEPVHIEGLGLLGSLLARHLAAAGHAFTWSDTDTHPAWPASTGLVYPDPDPRAAVNLALWGTWAARRDLLAADEVAPASYVYAQKTPPHGGKYATKPLDGTNLTLALADCWQVDPPTLVNRTRTAHADRRTDSPPPGARLVRAHAHIHRHCWGWSAPVLLDTSGLPPTPHRPAFIGRRISVNVYAYPLLSRPGWWRAGSAMYDQSTPRSLGLRTEAHLSRWLTDFTARFPQVPVLAAESPVEGWRPRPAPGHPGTVTEDDDGALRVPALYHSGVRLAPTVIGDLLHRLGVTP